MHPARFSSFAVLALALNAMPRAHAQTPEEQEAWQMQHAQALAAAKAREAQLEQQRAARKADPMAWVRTLDPMTAGGWEFRAVAPDGSWAAFSTEHQMKRSGHQVTVWLRQEYPEPQHADSGVYSSDVEQVQYDCNKSRVRAVTVVYFSGNNISGTQQTEENDLKQTPWEPVVPGTQGENIFRWACSRGK